MRKELSDAQERGEELKSDLDDAKNNCLLLEQNSLQIAKVQEKLLQEKTKEISTLRAQLSSLEEYIEMILM